MKVGDLIASGREVGWKEPGTIGLIIGASQPEYGGDTLWNVLWSDGETAYQHYGYELRLLEALSVAQYKIAHATNNK